MSGWDDFDTDLAFAGLSVVPSLQNSSNPDVARVARAATEVEVAVVKRFFLIEILGYAALLLLIPYWFGVAAFLLSTGATGWWIIGGAWGLGIMLPFFTLVAPLPEKVFGYLVVFAGAGIGIWALATGYFATIPAG